MKNKRVCEELRRWREYYDDPNFRGDRETELSSLRREGMKSVGREKLTVVGRVKC